MKDIYLLFNGNHNVLWNLSRSSLDTLLDTYPQYFVPHQVVSSMIEDELASKLEKTTGLLLFENGHEPIDVPIDFFQRKLQYWYGDFTYSQMQKKLGYGVWVIFDITGVAQYSFARHYVKNLYENKPEHYVAPPAFIKLTLEEMITIYAQHECQIIEEKI